MFPSSCGFVSLKLISASIVFASVRALSAVASSTQGPPGKPLSYRYSSHSALNPERTKHWSPSPILPTSAFRPGMSTAIYVLLLATSPGIVMACHTCAGAL